MSFCLSLASEAQETRLKHNMRGCHILTAFTSDWSKKSTTYKLFHRVNVVRGRLHVCKKINSLRQKLKEKLFSVAPSSPLPPIRV